MRKTLKLAVIISGAIFLTACSSTKSKSGAEGNEMQGVQTSGMSHGAGFGDEGAGGEFDRANRLKAPYNQRYHFDFNRYDVMSEDIESINVQANYLAAHPSSKVRLEGNADDRGSREYNVALGWKRAKAVAAILKQQGVSDSQIAMVSYGKEKPVAFGHDEASYRQNRRVDLIYEAK